MTSCGLDFSQLGREVLDIAARTVGVGVTTEEVDRVVHEVHAICHMTLMTSPPSRPV